MHNKPQTCLRCKYFRLETVNAGLCRVDKDRDKNYPRVATDAYCARWQDCGQQYFIRLGWIKAKTDKI